MGIVRKHIELDPKHNEDYKSQVKKARKSYEAVGEINRKAREQHKTYGQYVAEQWAKEHVKVQRPGKEGTNDKEGPVKDLLS